MAKTPIHKATKSCLKNRRNTVTPSIGEETPHNNNTGPGTGHRTTTGETNISYLMPPISKGGHKRVAMTLRNKSNIKNSGRSQGNSPINN